MAATGAAGRAKRAKEVLQVKRRQFRNFFTRELDEMKIIIEENDTMEQRQLAEALLANEMVRAIETERFSSHEVRKSDEEVTDAVLAVANIFSVQTQWAAVYRVLVDFCGWERDYTRFSARINALLSKAHSKFRCDYQSIQKPMAGSGILRKGFDEWMKYCAPKGDRVFPRQMFLARKLLKSLSIGEGKGDGKQ